MLRSGDPPPEGEDPEPIPPEMTLDRWIDREHVYGPSYVDEFVYKTLDVPVATHDDGGHTATGDRVPGMSKVQRNGIGQRRLQTGRPTEVLPLS